MENEEDDTLPLQYLNNENPYAFCQDYHKNSINMISKKEKLSALQRLQPEKLTMKMDQKHLTEERKVLLGDAVQTRRDNLIEEGMNILNVSEGDPESLFEQNFQIDRILEIAIELKKLSLISKQMHMRGRVSSLLQSKAPGIKGRKVEDDEKVIIDNLKEGLIFVQLGELSNNK